MREKSLWLIGAATLLLFGGGGLLLIHFVNGTPLTSLLFENGEPIYWQISIGLLVGIALSILVNQFMSLPFMAEEDKYFKKLFSKWELSYPVIFFLSLAAGFGEEIFFRGFLQPHLGIFLTSVIFVAIHGYLNPKRRIFFYGFFMIFAIAFFGWLFENIGAWSAITAHFLFDFILLVELKRQGKGFS